MSVVATASVPPSPFEMLLGLTPASALHSPHARPPVPLPFSLSTSTVHTGSTYFSPPATPSFSSTPPPYGPFLSTKNFLPLAPFASECGRAGGPGEGGRHTIWTCRPLFPTGVTKAVLPCHGRGCLSCWLMSLATSVGVQRRSLLLQPCAVIGRAMELVRGWRSWLRAVG